MQQTIIHGENIFIPVDAIPTGETTKYKTFIAGHSESGHHHVVKSATEFEVTIDQGNVWMRLMAPAEIVHKKSYEIHETVTLTPGMYQVKPAMEYNPFTKVMSRQFD